MKKRLSLLLWFSSCIILIQGVFSKPAKAQIVPDGTTETTVNADDNNFTIDRGDRAGSNIFHSFRDFSVPTGGSAFFDNAADVANIFSRVTGGNISSIDGLIRANGGANLFLINPAGVIFGSGARLDIGGSFLGSTADSILFPDDIEFSASDTQAQPILTINAPIGLNLRDDPGQIVNRSVADGVGLEVSTQNLALVGGQINLEGGRLRASEGTIELGSVAGNSVINLEENASGFALNYDGITSFGNIEFTQGAIVDSGSSINLQGEQISLQDGSQVRLTNSGLVSGESISVNAETLSIADRANISTATVGSGNGGDIKIETSSVEIAGTGFEALQENFIAANIQGTLNPESSTNATGIFTGTTGTGNAGNINLDTSNLRLTEGAAIAGLTFGEGTSGNLTIDATESIEVLSSGIFKTSTFESTGNGNAIAIDTTNLTVSNGGIIANATVGSGSGGEIIIDAIEQIEILGTQPNSLIPTAIFTTSFFGEGEPGDISINTQKLNLQDGGQIGSNSGGSTRAGIISQGGMGGDIEITASESIEVSGSSDDSFFPSNINSVTFTTNDAGNVNLETRNLIVGEGANISASTISDGKGGNLTINATESMTISGTSIDGQLLSSIVSSSGESNPTAEPNPTTATGNAGSLLIATGNLSISDRGTVAVNSLGLGDAGTLDISANSIRMENGATINAISNLGNGGNIDIKASESVEIVGTGFDAFQQNFIAGNIQGQFNIDSLDSGTGIFTGTAGAGTAGSINLNTVKLSLLEGAAIAGLTFGEGTSGNLTIDATESIEVLASGIFNTSTLSSTGNNNTIAIGTTDLTISDGGIIANATVGAGGGGDIIINATESIEVLGTFPGSLIPTAIFTTSFFGEGEPGNISIDTQKLNLQNGGQIGSNSGGSTRLGIIDQGGRGGDIIINATESIEVSGSSADSFFPSNINSSTFTANDAGNLTLETKNLIVGEGADISASTINDGQGGNLTIDATESITIFGTSGDGQLVSSIISSSGELNSTVEFDPIAATGDAGELSIATGNLSISDRGTVAVNSLGSGDAGMLEIQANDIQLENQGQIVAETVFGQGGNITLDIDERLTLADNSLISAQARENANGGNIDIDTNFIVAFPNQNNDILASAEQGEGGEIDISAESLFGIQEHTPDESTNDINATSEVSGLDGTVTITIPDLNPIQGTTELPRNVVETGQTTQQACQANRETAAKNGLIISGKGGIPPTSDSPLNSQHIFINGESDTTSAIPKPIETSQGKIQPARGIKVTESGKVILTAYRTNNAGDKPGGMATQRTPEIKPNCG